jgi:serine/threonine protein kinase
LGVVGGGLLLALLVFLFAMRRKLKSAIFRRGYGVDEQVEEETSVSQDPQIVTFKMETLMAATENFHDGNKLGEGGFGPVYKGTTQDGKEIAVKKLSLNSVQGKTEFLNEVNLVAKIQHRNLVKLLGCCAEGSERLIVYEYLANNSLDKILFDPVKRKQLDWQKRYNIILGIARGLLYLHQDSQPRIIHRDIKASNILLDDKLNPKIADFGLAKLFPEDESHVSTRVAGTYGYMAPEYAMQGQLTVKADVYSFGVLLLEVVTGRKNMDYNLSPEMQILLGWAWRSYEIGNIVQMIDPLALIERCSEQQALRCIQVGLLCTQAEASLRPPMSTATLMLSSHSATLPNPTKPVFVSSTNQNTSSSSSVSGLSHLNETTLSLPPPFTAHATVTEFVPR